MKRFECGHDALEVAVFNDQVELDVIDIYTDHFRVYLSKDQALELATYLNQSLGEDL